jgi:S-adenosylmethionine/arginine decarboxylase-like enzyme
MKLSDEEVSRRYRSEKAWGLCTSIDLKQCNPYYIRDPEYIEKFIIDVCDFIEMKRFGEPTIVKFGSENKEGYSFTQLIETSLVSGHLVDETNDAYIDIFSCKEYKPIEAMNFCKRYFKAKEATCNVFFRK